MSSAARTRAKDEIRKTTLSLRSIPPVRYSEMGHQMRPVKFSQSSRTECLSLRNQFVQQACTVAMAGIFSLSVAMDIVELLPILEKSLTQFSIGHLLRRFLRNSSGNLAIVVSKISANLRRNVLLQLRRFENAFHTMYYTSASAGNQLQRVRSFERIRWALSDEQQTRLKQIRI
jgi:hypothetical protein